MPAKQGDKDPTARTTWLTRTAEGKVVGGRVAIIGAAAGGISTLGNLVRSEASIVDSVVLIDPMLPGSGPVFNAESHLLLCNTPAGITSLRADEPDDLLNYLVSCGQPTKPDAYVPRDLVGEYARARYQEYMALAAARGIKVTHNPTRANAIRRREDGRYEVSLEDGLPQEFDRVVICTGFNSYKVADGFVPHAGHPRLVASPYPATHLRQRLNHRRSHVLVLGTGQSAVDAAIVLCHEGHRVTMASRSGILPSIRGPHLPAPAIVPVLVPIPDFDPDDPLLGLKLTRVVVQALRVITRIPLRHQLSSAADPAQRLREEVELLIAGRHRCQDIVISLADHLIAWTLNIPPAVHASLMSAHHHVLWRYVSSMAVDNAVLLLKYIDAGQLRIRSYDPTKVAAHGTGFDVGIRGHGRQRFDYAVNAVGVNPPVLHADARTVYLKDPPTSATLLNRLEKDLRVRLSPEAPPEQIWLVGQATHIQTPFAHFLPLAALQAAKVVCQLSAAVGPLGRRHTEHLARQAPDWTFLPATWKSYEG